MDGLRRECKECWKAAAKKWTEKNQERSKASDRAYYEKNKQRWVQNDLDRKYGITYEIYIAMLHDQAFRCKICETHQSSCRRRLAVDHCHVSGVIRGALCDECNLALGTFKDNPVLLRKAAEYVEKNGNI